MPPSFLKDVEECLNALKDGKLILYPTDTVWGIGCDATDMNAIERIYRLKKRPDKKTMIVLVSNKNEISKYADVPDKLFIYLEQRTTPTTVIYQNAVNLAQNLVADDGSIAIRICKDEFCRHLIKSFGKPIVSTSANISGLPAPKTFQEISDEIKKGVDYIVRYRQDDKIAAQPSSVIQWNPDGSVNVLRP